MSIKKTSINIDEELYAKLKVIAKKHRRSVTQELSVVVENYVEPNPNTNAAIEEMPPTMRKAGWIGDK